MVICVLNSRCIYSDVNFGGLLLSFGLLVILVIDLLNWYDWRLRLFF